MSIELNIITGLMLGAEYVDMDDGERHIVIDILFARFVITF
jgi:hypothetical protein